VIVNPYTPEGQALLAPIPGTHIIEDSLGLVGSMFRDPTNLVRQWTIRALYTPVRGRSLGGLRAKLEDQKGFITFCNQRDLEVLLDIASPGGYCAWLDDEYVEPGERDWYGLCVDDLDLLDDLYDRELEARAQYPNDVVLPQGLSFERRVHNGVRNDFIELMSLLWDIDPDTGMGPDTRMATVDRRWTSIERTAGAERQKLWLRV